MSKTKLNLGDKAPSFSLLNQDGKTSTLESLISKNGLVLYFYPRDLTPGCTVEACDFRDNFQRLKKLGFNIVGISKDDPKKHTKFVEKENLNFTLLADTDGVVCEKYGVWQLKKFMGKEHMGIVRTTFVLNSSGKIVKIYANVKVKGHVDQIIEELKEIK